MATESFIIKVNRTEVRVTTDMSVAAAMMMAGEPCRISVRGEPRAPMCGMGICMECRATVDGRKHQRTCQVMCVPGMEVVTE
ncbi:2Fe-2S iron-sulfur cluster-binding protein [Occallatibacter savannae]|uniref:2Fe-2S iron-sulfur cluster-binding protein n=1 Tax=Occallatibacter savannae TaxID=1002691 RepID=UPI001EF4B816|nr:2Fe-2S iron-sulfur cluster-binding protein [Occallatibacter savannae]